MNGAPPHATMLMIDRRQLQDKYLLSDYDIANEAVMHLVLKFRGD